MLVIVHFLYQHVCLEEFQKFKDKSSAFNRGTAANKELAEMILRHHRPGQALAVGKPEYKRFIETSLVSVKPLCWVIIVGNFEYLFYCHLFQQDVPCLFNETVMEVMWGLENLMDSLVPQEEVKLTKEDRLPICQGIKIFLNHHGFDVKPEMVSSQVAFLMSEMKCFLVYRSCHVFVTLLLFDISDSL
jgi:nucleolar protein 58